MAYTLNEDDWKLFRSKLPVWKERFASGLIGEYVRLLQGTGTAGEKFWALKNRIDSDSRMTGIDTVMTRSMMVKNIVSLFREGAITMNDLDGFSDGLKKSVDFLFKEYERL